MCEQKRMKREREREREEKESKRERAVRWKERRVRDLLADWILSTWVHMNQTNQAARQPPLSVSVPNIFSVHYLMQATLAFQGIVSVSPRQPS